MANPGFEFIVIDEFEDGARYCKSCGALDEDSLYDFGPED
jgi:transcription initiation factor TFIIIB Brf1 subunit/transcription initiation factor TFIIB